LQADYRKRNQGQVAGSVNPWLTGVKWMHDCMRVNFSRLSAVSSGRPLARPEHRTRAG